MDVPQGIIPTLVDEAVQSFLVPWATPPDRPLARWPFPMERPLCRARSAALVYGQGKRGCRRGNDRGSARPRHRENVRTRSGSWDARGLGRTAAPSPSATSEATKQRHHRQGQHQLPPPSPCRNHKEDQESQQRTRPCRPPSPFPALAWLRPYELTAARRRRAHRERRRPAGTAGTQRHCGTARCGAGRQVSCTRRRAGQGTRQRHAPCIARTRAHRNR